MFTYTRKARYYETDKMGIIHHSNYIRWMEEARCEYMDSIGYGYAKAEENKIASPVAALSVEYKSPVHFDDIVEIKLSISRYSGVVLEVQYEFFNTTTGQLSVIASSKHCYTNEQGQVVSLKKALPELHAVMAAEFEKDKN